MRVRGLRRRHETRYGRISLNGSRPSPSAGRRTQGRCRCCCTTRHASRDGTGSVIVTVVRAFHPLPDIAHHVERAVELLAAAADIPRGNRLVRRITVVVIVPASVPLVPSPWCSPCHPVLGRVGLEARPVPVRRLDPLIFRGHVIQRVLVAVEVRAIVGFGRAPGVHRVTSPCPACR